MRRMLVAILYAGILAGCGNDSDSGANTTPTMTPSNGAVITTELVGSWHRAQTCPEMLAAFEAAGLAESHREWLQGNFYGGQPGPTSGGACADAQGPLEHDHFFTGDGEFGSHDENGEEVDGGDFEVVDDDTVSFPSHATEFGYDGDLVVDYSIDGDVAIFHASVPAGCDNGCADAYAWALSAFASGPWARGEVP